MPRWLDKLHWWANYDHFSAVKYQDLLTSGPDDFIPGEQSMEGPGLSKKDSPYSVDVTLSTKFDDSSFQDTFDRLRKLEKQATKTAKALVQVQKELKNVEMTEKEVVSATKRQFEARRSENTADLKSQARKQPIMEVVSVEEGPKCSDMPNCDGKCCKKEDLEANLCEKCGWKPSGAEKTCISCQKEAEYARSRPNKP